MRYSDDLIEEVRSRNDIVDVVSGYVKIQKRGGTYFGLCPFHNEKTASFSVTPAKQMYYCFGCGAGGNVFTFLMEYENYTFTEAMQALAQRAGVELPKVEETAEQRREADLRSRLLEINKLAGVYFYRLMNSPRGQRAMDYFLGRGLTPETIKRFGLGYSDNYRDDLYKFLKSKGFDDETLKETGLVKVKENDAYDMFFNRAMFPIMDSNNKIIGFGGRVMGEGEPKYLNSPETKLFDKSRNLYGLNYARTTRKPYFLICEGYMDVISLHQAGFTNAVAPLGTALTQGQANLIKRYVKQVILTFDSDGAGVKAALRAIPIFKEAGISVKVLNLKPYKDPDEFIKHMGAAAFEERITQAENAFMFEIAVKSREYDMSDPEQQTAFWHMVTEKLAGFTDEIERNSYLEAVSRRYTMDQSALKRRVNAIGARSMVSAQENPEEYRKKRQKEKVDGLKKSERLMLTWLTSDEKLYPKLSKWITADEFVDEPYHEAAKMVFADLLAGKKPEPARILNHFIENEEAYREVAALFNTTIDEQLSADERNKAITETVKRLKRNSLDIQSRSASDLTKLQEIFRSQKELDNLHLDLD